MRAHGATGDVRCGEHRWTAEAALVTGATQLAAGPTHLMRPPRRRHGPLLGDDALGQLGPRDPATGTVAGLDAVIDVVIDVAATPA